MNLRKHLVTLSAIALGFAVSGAQAGQATADFDVTVTITSTCSIATASDVAFGSVASTATGVKAVGRLDVNCTPGTEYQIALDAGRNAGDDINARAMKGAGGTLVPYQLFQDEARSIVWGSTPKTNTVVGTGTGSRQDVPVYGHLPSANFAAGSYADTVTATITY